MFCPRDKKDRTFGEKQARREGTKKTLYIESKRLSSSTAINAGMDIEIEHSELLERSKDQYVRSISLHSSVNVSEREDIYDEMDSLRKGRITI